MTQATVGTECKPERETGGLRCVYRAGAASLRDACAKSTRHEILEPWKNAYEGLQRFQDCPDDPMKHVYPAMVEMAIERKALDTNDVVDQLDSCILAWVDS